MKFLYCVIIEQYNIRKYFNLHNLSYSKSYANVEKSQQKLMRQITQQ